MCGTLIGEQLFIAGGNRNGKLSNSFLRLDLTNLSVGWHELPEYPEMHVHKPFVPASVGETTTVSIYGRICSFYGRKTGNTFHKWLLLFFRISAMDACSYSERK